MNNETPTTTIHKKPIHTIRSGAISVSIWRKDGKDGGFFYTGNVQRCYKGSDDKWQYSDSFGRDELPLAAKLLDMAHTWIIVQEAKAAREASQA